MYIVAIGWLYVALMMAITEHNIVAGVATFVFYGLGPVALLLYILGTPARRRRRRAREAGEAPGTAPGKTPESAPGRTPEEAAPATGDQAPAAKLPAEPGGGEPPA